VILPKHSIDKKNTFLPVLANAHAILKSDDFKNTIFKNAMFKFALFQISTPKRALSQLIEIADFSTILKFAFSKSQSQTLQNYDLV
jgi:hypothetical protein